MKQKFIFPAILVMLATVALCTSPLPAAQEAGGIAFIDSQRVVDESKAGKASLKELEEFKKKNEEELSKRDREIKEIEEELQKKKFALSPDAQSQMEESIRRKKIEFNRFKEDKELELKDLYFKHLTKIKEEIIQIVQKLGKEKGYAIILNKDESVIYAKPDHDITDLVIESYDRDLTRGPDKK